MALAVLVPLVVLVLVHAALLELLASAPRVQACVVLPQVWPLGAVPPRRLVSPNVLTVQVRVRTARSCPFASASVAVPACLFAFSCCGSSCACGLPCVWQFGVGTAPPSFLCAPKASCCGPWAKGRAPLLLEGSAPPNGAFS